MLAELAETAAPRGFLIACDLLGSRAEAEDAVQEALARACEHVDRLREPAAIRGWFFRVLTNLCLRSLRRRRYRRALTSLWTSADAPAPRPRSDHHPAAVLERDRRVGALLGALDDLPPRQRAALVLRYGHDLSVAEVADILGVTPETAKTHLSRGLARLRGKLAKRGDSP